MKRAFEEFCECWSLRWICYGIFCHGIFLSWFDVDYVKISNRSVDMAKHYVHKTEWYEASEIEMLAAKRKLL